MNDKLELLDSELGPNRVKTGIKVSGGVAEYFFIATSERELIRAVLLSRELNIPPLIIGSGSKITVSSNRINCFVIKNRSDNIKISGVKGKVSKEGLGIEEAFVEAGSGVSLENLNDFAKKQRLECIPLGSKLKGTIGGSLLRVPLIQIYTHRVKVLTKLGSIKIKQFDGVTYEDIIISVTLKFKAQK